MKIAVCVAFIVSVAVAAVVKRQAADAGGVYHLPDGAELIVGSITGGFTCDDKIYGYYADIANECRIFHVCVPQVDEAGNPTPLLYSFFCGNQTVFDQQYLVCASYESATPCAEAQGFYSRNENFGRTDVPFISDTRK